MKGRRGGFTVTEMLTVVGILAVTMAAAIPAVVTLRAGLKMRELDDTAREIFLAAQNGLTARKAAGVSLELGERDDKAGGYYWLSSDDPDIKALLPAGSIEGVAASSHCMIWYNAGSAAVLEVYYAENAVDKRKIKNGGYSDHYSGGGKAARREDRIGYYNGGDLEPGGVEALIPPKLKIENTNMLTARITVPKDKAAGYIKAGVALTVTVVELGRDGDVISENRQVFSNAAYDIFGEVGLPLDSLNDGGRFRNICPNIAPGANIRVTAMLSGPADGEKSFLPASAYADANSLFAGRTASDGSDTLYIAYARHLQNLEPAVSGASESGNCYAEQTAEIVWPAGMEFRPICNRSLRGYNGNGNEIGSLRVNCGNAVKISFPNSGTGGSSGAGLFAFVEEAELTNIRLVDPVLTGRDLAGAEYVGALAGILRGSSVSSCQVYATGYTAEIDCAGHAGGLIGLALDDYTIAGSSASLPRIRSALDRAYIGGLIGRVRIDSGYTTGLVKGCYADTGWMGEDKKWIPDSGLQGTNAAIGGLIGGTWNSSGIDQVTDCYALGWFSGGSGEGLLGRSLGTYRISTSYSILQSGSGDHYYIGESSINSLSALKTFGGPNWTANGSTTPYHADVCPAPYPYPMLSLRHYGDWPVQTVDGIRLFDGNTAGSKRAHYIMMPASGAAVTFYAEAQNGGGPAMEAVTVGGKGVGIAGAKAGYDEDTGRTWVTLTAEDNTSPQVTYVDLKAGGSALRAVVVLYDAAVTLTGENTRPVGADLPAKSTASSDGTSEIGTLTLRRSANEGVFTAGMAVHPGRNEIEGALRSLAPQAGDTFVLSTTAEGGEDPVSFAGWERIRTSDPSVTANGDPGAGTNILAPDGGSFYPEAGPGGTLTVTGVASGTATVSARWAMDEALKADCEVKMVGARALIRMASAEGTARTDGNWKETKDNYPYRLDLIAEPGEQIDLTFTPMLFGGHAGEDGTYTWAIDGKDIGTTSPAGQDNGAWTYTLTDDRPRAAYTVTLTYTNDGGEKSVDFMTFSVYRAVGKDVSDHQAIKLYDRGGRREILGETAGQVEQIAVPDTEYAAADRIELEGCVDGAENTRIRWYARAKGSSDWMQVTGIMGSQAVPDENGGARAKVEWVSDEIGGENYNVLSADGKTLTGGAIRVTGLDVNEYGEDFEIELKAEAMESAGDGEAPSYKIVTVKVMRKLQIAPRAKAVVSVDSEDFTFEANRTDTARWQYEWSWTGKGTGTGSGERYTISPIRQHLTGGHDKNATNTITCKFGPYTVTATYTWQGIFQAMATPINADHVDGQPGETAAANVEYFIVEKGEIRELELAWGSSNITLHIMDAPDGTDCIGITPKGGSDRASGGIGWRTYDVTGRQFTYDDVEKLSWKIGNIITNWDFPKYFAVVGMEIDGPGGIPRDGSGNLLLEKGQTVQLSAAASFAKELWAEGTVPTLTWGSDHMDLVEVDQTGKIVAVKNGAATYAATITATYAVECKNGKTYTFRDHITVKVQPAGTMEVMLEPCTAQEDLTALQGVFQEDGLTRDSVLAPVDGAGRWTLIRNEDFGLNTMYLKAAAALNGRRLDDLKDHISRVSGDASYLEITAGSIGGTVYIRLRAKEANVDVTETDLTAEIGTASAEGKVYIYDAPSVKLTRTDDRGGIEDVTNGSRPVYLNETDLSIKLTAALGPTLYSYEDRGKTALLDTIEWDLWASAGYEPDRYLDLVPSDDNRNEVTVTLKREDLRMPDFRVVICARSREGGSAADAGYALVFLPEEGSEEP